MMPARPHHQAEKLTNHLFYLARLRCSLHKHPWPWAVSALLRWWPRSHRAASLHMARGSRHNRALSPIDRPLPSQCATRRRRRHPLELQEHREWQSISAFRRHCHCQPGDVQICASPHCCWVQGSRKLMCRARDYFQATPRTRRRWTRMDLKH
jgi:hypothetical protein